MADVVRPTSALSAVSDWGEWPTRSPTPGERWENRVMPGARLLPVFCDDRGSRSLWRCTSAPPDLLNTLNLQDKTELSRYVLEDTTNLQLAEAGCAKTSPGRRSSPLMREEEEMMFMSTCTSTPMMLMSTSTSVSPPWLQGSPSPGYAQPMEPSGKEHRHRPASAPDVLSRAGGETSVHQRAAPSTQYRRDLSQALGERSSYGDGEVEDNISVVSCAESDSVDHIPTSVANSLMSLQSPCTAKARSSFTM
mmetsp:Transcript_14931/g.24423  ORF Transcript_14931/g.24423 Transcript_14931/m.24423 type:complete len:250 (-) Transcript_14931:12-761(-)